MKRVLLAIAYLGLTAFTTASHLAPAPALLAPWTEALQQRQPDDAFVAVYQFGHHHLVFVAAEHANETGSKTFRLIDAAFAAYRFDTAILEGFPTSRGANPAKLIEQVLASPPKNGFADDGETYPAVRGAVAQGAKIWGGEPDDLDVKAFVLAKRLLLDASILPSFADWAHWYATTNHRPIGVDFDTEETGPRVDGRFPSNKIAAVIAGARDAHLHRLIVAHLEANESVIVVYGGSHLMMQRPALDAVLGPPCYFGDDIVKSRTKCRVG